MLSQDSLTQTLIPSSVISIREDASEGCPLFQSSENHKQKILVNNDNITNTDNFKNRDLKIEEIADDSINQNHKVEENIDCFINQDHTDDKDTEQNSLDAIQEKEDINIENIENLAIKYSKENDSEKIYQCLSKLIEEGKCTIPIDYALNLYELGHYKQSFNYFCLISQTNHPIANYFIGIMKFYGHGCNKNREESYQILKNLSDNGIERATEFIEDHIDEY